MQYFTDLRRQIDQWIEPPCKEDALDIWKRIHQTAVGLEAFGRALSFDLRSEFTLSEEQSEGVHAIIAILVSQFKADVATLANKREEAA